MAYDLDYLAVLGEELPKGSVDLDYFLRECLHEKQREYVVYGILNRGDDFKEYVTFFGGKRGGKSKGNVAKSLLSDLLVEKWGNILYMSGTVEQAKRLSWMGYLKMNKELKLGWDFKDGKNLIRMRNSDLIFGGLKDIKSAQFFQGMPIKLCIIDEPQYINNEVSPFFV